MRCTIMGISLNVTMASLGARKRIGVRNKGFITVRNLDRDTIITRQVRRLPAALLPEASDQTIFLSEDDLRLLRAHPGDTFEADLSHDQLECP